MSDTHSRPTLRPKKKATLAKVVPLLSKRSSTSARSNSRPKRGIEPEALQHALIEMAQLIPVTDSGTEAFKAQLTIIQELLKAKACFIATSVTAESGLQIASVRGRNDPRISTGNDGNHAALQRAFEVHRVQREDGVIAAPLKSGNGVLGCVAVVDAKIFADDGVMETLAAQLAAAIDVGRNLDDAARRAKDLQTAVAGLKSLEAHRDEMLSNVSHDLKNPLTTVKAYLAMLARGKMGPLTDAQTHALSVCDRSTDRLLRMINDLLLLSRLQTGKMQLSDRPFGIKTVMEELLNGLSTLAQHAEVQFELMPCPEVYIRGDKDKFAEAIYNLLDAALSRSRPNDVIEVQLKATEPGIGILTIRDKGRVLLPSELEHLFDGYHHSRSLRGTRLGSSGLGLPLAGKIVQLHGGRVQVTSTDEEGTRFEVFVPLFAGAVAPTALSHPPRAGGVLLVEDDVDVRDVLQKLLEEEDFRVDIAGSANDAIASLNAQSPAMVLLDLRLGGSDGRTVLHHIRQTPLLAQIPVYVISGASDIGQWSLRQGDDRIDGYFEKPVSLPKLLNTVASIVRPAGQTSVAT